MRKFIWICISLLMLQLNVAAQTLMKGQVTSKEDGTPLPGVSVVNKSAGPGVGVATDIDGNFSINVKKGDVLVFTFIGMETQEITVHDQKSLNVALKSDTEVMDEVVVIGYGERRKGTITGSVSTVGAEKLADKPVASFDQALQGQVAGVEVITSSGEPSASSTIRIRGINSISAGTEPLYIMDGVAITEGDFASLNTNDIASISVLKDASSTSIYGSRAANGVVVITTRKGKYGEGGKINFRAMYGFSNMIDNGYEMMSSKELLDLEVAVGLRDANDIDIENLSKINTNWQDEIYRTGQTQNYELSFVGGSEKINYYISGSYFNQEGIAPRSGLERYTMRSNVEAKLKPWARVGANISLGYMTVETTESGASTLNPAVAAQITKPYLPVRKADGTLYERWDDKLNPVYSIEKHPADTRSLKLIASLFLEVNPIKNLTLKSLVGLDGSDTENQNKSLPSFVDNEVGGGYVSVGFSRGYRWTITNTASYRATLNDIHNFNVMLGQEAIQYKEHGFSARNEGVDDDRLSFLSAGTVATRASGGGEVGYSYMSYFGRLDYNYLYKYYFDFSIRGDGCSRFAPGHRWANFWSAGLMWDLKKEDFLADNSVLTSTQLSFSAGTSGNSDIPLNTYMSTAAAGPIYGSVSGLTPLQNPGNESLSWEKKFSTNVGLSLGLWERASFKIEYYYSKTSDLLLEVPLSQVTGYSSMMQNVGKMRNSGLDLTIEGDILRLKDFRWNINANISYVQNKILELYEGSEGYVESDTGTKLQAGKPNHSYFMPRFAGVNPANGDPLWYDVNGEVVNYFSNENSVWLGKSFDAPWTGGFTTTFSYKGITLSAFFNWVAQKYIMNNNRYFTENTSPEVITEFHQSKAMLNMWKKPGDVTDIPRAGTQTQFDDHLVEDASYLRLKNLSLSWNVPARWLNRTNVFSSVRIYAQGQNLLTFTKFQGYDPESSQNLTFGRYPAARQFTFGLDVSF